MASCRNFACASMPSLLFQLLLILYAVCWFYPIYIFGYQFRSSVNYHLKHRDPSEEAPCTITLMNNAIMADIPEHNLVYTYEWNQFTNVYNKFGYYMLFNKGRMIVMLSQKDMPDDIKVLFLRISSHMLTETFAKSTSKTIHKGVSNS